MRKILSIVLVMVLLASAVPLAITPASAQQAGIPCDDGDNELTKDELVAAILPYMLDEGDFKLDDIGDAAWVYAYWDGEPKTIVDDSKVVSTFYRPIERIVNLHHHIYAPLQTIKATDKVVGIESTWFGESHKHRPSLLYPKFVDLPQVGKGGGPDYEKILNLQPELVFSLPGSYSVAVYNRLKELSPDLAVVRLYLYQTYNRTLTVENYRTLGYLLDREEEAEEFIDYYEGFLDVIAEKIEDIPEEDKPQVFGMRIRGAGKITHTSSEVIIAAGGKDIFEGVKGSQVGVEDIIDRDPEIIIRTSQYGKGGYGKDDITELKNLRDEVMNRPEFQNMTAVKTGRVYIIAADMDCCGASGGRYFLGIAYYAKCIYPDLDLDPTAFHQEFLTRFQGVDYDLSKHGTFAYHPEQFPEGR